MQKLYQFVKQEASSNFPVYPPPAKVFNAFNSCPFERVKVVILGQVRTLFYDIVLYKPSFIYHLHCQCACDRILTMVLDKLWGFVSPLRKESSSHRVFSTSLRRFMMMSAVRFHLMETWRGGAIRYTASV
jgi:hypothetical protein